MGALFREGSPIVDIRDLIISNADEIATNEPAAKKPRKAPAAPTWEVVLQDHCDAAIRRKTAKTSRLLVLLMSQNQFYIKDEKTGEVTKLDATSLQNFMKGCDLRDTKFVPWCQPFFSSRRASEHFCAIIGDENLQWLALRGLHVLSFNDSKYSGYEDRSWELEKKRKKYDNPLNRTVKKVVEEVIGKERTQQLLNDAEPQSMVEHRAKSALKNEFQDDLAYITDKFGLDWSRVFLREFLTAPFVGKRMPRLSYYGDQLFRVTNFEPGRFIEYLLFESTRQGYGFPDNAYYYSGRADLDDFLRTWGDTLQMQMRTRRKVYDKYPDDLDSMHRKLAFKSIMFKHEIDEFAFKAHSERLAEHSKTDAWYTIRPPFNKEDMLDEATQQANCLASYIDAYTNDETDLYFMRASIEPEKSLVTVEVRDGRIRQAYAACNRRPGDDELKWLAEWAEENGIEMVDADHQHPMAA